MGSGFAFEKLNEVRNVKDLRTLAVDGVPVLLGLSHFEMTPTTEVEAVNTSGKLRPTKLSDRTSSIASASQRQKEARSVKVHEVHAPDGAKTRLGLSISVMTPTTEVAAVVTLGRSNRDGHLSFMSQLVECASKRRRAALSARETAKAAVDGAQARVPLGHCHFEMIQMGVLVAVLIIGI